jgi:hypothetical protein
VTENLPFFCKKKKSSKLCLGSRFWLVRAWLFSIQHGVGIRTGDPIHQKLQRSSLDRRALFFSAQAAPACSLPAQAERPETVARPLPLRQRGRLDRRRRDLSCCPESRLQTPEARIGKPYVVHGGRPAAGRALPLRLAGMHEWRPAAASCMHASNAECWWCCVEGSSRLLARAHCIVPVRRCTCSSCARRHMK